MELTKLSLLVVCLAGAGLAQRSASPSNSLNTLPAFDPGGPATLSTWILTIATRLVLNELRRPELASLEREPLGEERADHASERARLGAAIASGVARLPEGQRAVLVLREYHELEYTEIADALEITLATVKWRIYKAREEVAAALARDGITVGTATTTRPATAVPAE